MGLNMLEQAIVATTSACSHIRQAVFRFRKSRIKRLLEKCIHGAPDIRQ